jgi:tRNA-specific 2-thiouridylase
VELHRAVDPARDQSYFLFATTQEQLDYLRFPLGGIDKAQFARLAAELGLGVADKPDSQDICFVPDGAMPMCREAEARRSRPGEIVHLDGRVLGQHKGLIHYTVGQRRGLEVGGLPDPVYVVRLDPAAKRVIVGPKTALAVRAARLSEINWLGGDFSARLAPRCAPWPSPCRRDSTATV